MFIVIAGCIVVVGFAIWQLSREHDSFERNRRQAQVVADGHVSAAERMLSHLVDEVPGLSLVGITHGVYCDSASLSSQGPFLEAEFQSSAPSSHAVQLVGHQLDAIGFKPVVSIDETGGSYKSGRRFGHAAAELSTAPPNSIVLAVSSDDFCP